MRKSAMVEARALLPVDSCARRWVCVEICGSTPAPGLDAGAVVDVGVGMWTSVLDNSVESRSRRYPTVHSSASVPPGVESNFDRRRRVRSVEWASDAMY